MTLYVISIPFFAVGFIKGIIDFIKSIKKRKFSAEAGVLLWFIAEFIMGMMLNEAITSRMNGIFFSVLYYIVIGIAFVIDVVKKVQLKAVISTVIAVAYLVFSISFIRYYFTSLEMALKHGFVESRVSSNRTASAVVTRIPSWIALSMAIFLSASRREATASTTITG